MYRFIISLCLLIAFSNTIRSQENKSKIQVTGTVFDAHGNPIKGALVFVDKVKTKVKSNKKGIFKIKMRHDAELLSVYSTDHGILSTVFEGQLVINFEYPKDSELVTEDMLVKLGFTLEPASTLENNYFEFSSILEILDKRFYNVRVTDGEIKIGKGTNAFNADLTPLILVDGHQVSVDVMNGISTADVRSIRVIHRGSEAAEYGGINGANGVILITLKKD